MAEISRVPRCSASSTPLAYKAIEGATVFCKLRGNPYVELQHWLLPDPAMRRTPTCTASSSTSDSTPSALARDLTGRARPAAARRHVGHRPVEHVENAVERGWVYGSLMFGEPQVRTGHLVVGLLKTPIAAQCAAVASRRQFERVKLDDLTENFARIVEGSPEDGQPPATASRRGDAGRGERRDRAGGDGQAGGAQALRRRPDRAGAQRARSIPSSAATRRSARSSTS